MTTIGLIGSGNIGTAIARQAVAQGHDVVLSNSRGPETLADLVAELGPRARAATAQEAAEAGEVVVVTIPFHAVDQVPVEPLAGKVVIDTNNYYFERDGHDAAIDRGEDSPSERLAAHLPGSRVVKAFNAIQAAHIVDAARPAGDAERRAIPIAGDDAEAKQVVAGLIDSFGFDPVDAGPLAEGRRFDRDKPAYGAEAGAAATRELIAQG
ncbi:NADPH-dependent F420 reductase [Nocardioides marmotae]|uniref:NADP oxidoreductase n=1 Tax=Nocardioides marmotae TaxID=2663857 RepID=A0A6I3IU53_9ACTN|nr:NADPH-dependent F420 reductase [Nocardioides marmotae]MCR6030369.1 NADP oxidoreductase [Gordonia jinghuaiqii]MBC9734501.1 NADPH-dependent F420 reductase [Nocardioides marmotae]MTB85601.1 NADP oxidoreductase [Nocardioides marmotae]MTB94003.1 NADP oxidoreductase [Nocardioides marmotae]QKE00318.1 NADPH-dependent F420 reductase [Nocardioides marmotae]